MSATTLASWIGVAVLAAFAILLLSVIIILVVVIIKAFRYISTINQ